MHLDLIEKAEHAHSLEEDEIVSLLADEVAEDKMAEAADRVRAAYVGDGVHLRGLIEFSNICRQNCMYCGLRRDNMHTERYRMQPEEILAMAQKAKSYGYHTIVMQSGEDMHFSASVLTSILREIKKLDVAITLSIGERSFDEYKAFREAGADRYLLRIETTDKALYERMDPEMSFENRLRCLRDLRTLGYEVGTGSLIGLPGQSLDSLARDILFFQRIDADMIGIGPFIPNGETPLAGELTGDFHLTRRMVALLRLLLPEANIPATTAVETLVRGGRIQMLQSGANVVMPNVTEGDYRRKYALYPGKSCVADTPVQCRQCMGSQVQAIGRYIADNKGFRQHLKSVDEMDRAGLE